MFIQISHKAEYLISELTYFRRVLQSSNNTTSSSVITTRTTTTEPYRSFLAFVRSRKVKYIYIKVLVRRHQVRKSFPTCWKGAEAAGMAKGRTDGKQQWKYCKMVACCHRAWPCKITIFVPSSSDFSAYRPIATPRLSRPFRVIISSLH